MRLLLFIPLAAALGFVGGRMVPRSSPAPQVAAPIAPLKMDPVGVAAGEGVVSDEELSARLVAAVETERDPLRAAAQLLAVIDGLTLADFKRIQRNPALLEQSRLADLDLAFHSDFVDAVVERWLELDPAAGPAIWACDESTDLGLLTFALARTNPAIVLAREFEDELPESALVALGVMAEQDLSAAQRFVDGLTGEMRDEAELQVARTIAQTDPLAGVALAKSLKKSEIFDIALKAATGAGRDLVARVLSAADESILSPGAVLAAQLRYPDLAVGSTSARDYAYAEQPSFSMYLDARRLPAEARLAMLSDLDRAPSGAQKALATALLRAWMIDDAPAAMAWAWDRVHQKVDELDAVNAAEEILSAWVSDDWDAAYQWFSQQKPSSIRTEIGNQLAKEFADDEETEKVLALADPADEAVYGEVIAELALNLASRKPVEAREWFDRLPASTQADTIGRFLGRSYPNVSASWLEALPADVREEGIARLGSLVVRDDREAATAWLAQIGHQGRRETAAEDAYEHLRSTDPAGARAWLRAVPGLRPGRVESYLRMFGPK